MKKLLIWLLLVPTINFSQELIQYAENNDLTSISNAIQKGVYIDQVDSGGFTALHIASWNGYIPIVKYLLSQGANPNIQSSAGSPPMRFATPEAKNILKSYGGVEETSNKPTVPRLLYSPNIFIEQAPNTAPVRTIISNVISNIVTNISNFTSNTVYVSNFISNTTYISNTYEIYDYPKKSYNLLTNLTTDESIALHDWDIDGNNSIQQAAKDGNLDVIKTLIKYGINPKAKNVRGDTALRFATEYNHIEVVKYLVEDIGLDVNNANRDGNTALIMATFNDNTEMIRYLAHMGANINQTASASVSRTVGDEEIDSVVTGWTALMAAAQMGYTNSLEVLLDSGANLNATDSDNWNALLFAVQNGHYDAAEFLIDRGINYNIESKDFNTALSLATLNGDEPMIDLLNDIGAIESSVPLVSYESSYTEVTEESDEYYYEEEEGDEYADDEYADEYADDEYAEGDEASSEYADDEYADEYADDEYADEYAEEVA